MATNGTSIKLEDGRTVVFGQRQKLDKEILFTAGRATGVRFSFRNGQVLILDLSDIDADTSAHLRAHGVSQKCGDECAELDSVEDMVEAVGAMIDRLKAGKWTADRQGFAGQSILIDALIEVTKQTRDQVRAVLKTLSVKERAALKSDPTIKPVVDRLEADRSKGVDTNKILDKFSA